jgi:hypothetical protein
MMLRAESGATEMAGTSRYFAGWASVRQNAQYPRWVIASVT